MPLKHSLLLIVFAGCGATEDAATCPPNTECGKPPPAALKLAAELVPPMGSDQVQQEVAELAFDESGVATVTLGPRATIDGFVYGTEAKGMPAQVVVSRPSLVPGNPQVVVQTTTDMDGHFALSVPRGSAAYRLTVLPRPPSDALYPPVTWPLTADDASEPDPTAPVTVKVVLCLAGGSAQCPALHQLAWIGGRVTDPFGQGLPGVRVTAADLASGELVSSVATTGDAGEFDLYLSPGVGAEQTVHVVAAITLAADGLPDGQLALSRDVKVGGGDAGELRRPALPASLPFQLPIGGKAPSGAQQALAGARVDFAADLGEIYGGGRARYTTSATTDGEGLARVQLVPGTGDANRGYAVTVTPPPDAVFARGTFQAVPVGTAAGVLGGVDLAVRPLLAGHLVGADGAPVKGATVQAQPSRAAVNSDNTGDLTVASTLTGGDGAFALRVDRAWYDVEFVPPAAAPLPRWSVDNQDVEADLDLSTVALPRAVLTSVRVLGPVPLVDPDGKPVLDGDGKPQYTLSPISGIEVRALALAYDAACPQSPGACPLPARLRGTGVTDGSGSAALLLPAP